MNTYWRHVGAKVLISERGRAYRSLVSRMAMALRIECHGSARVSVHITAYPPDNRRRDLDNILKSLLDALQHAGVYDDDSQIDELHIWRGPVVRRGHVNVTVTPFRAIGAGK